MIDSAGRASVTPDDPARRQRQCIGKRKYVNPSEARDVAKLMHKKYKAKFSAYQCDFCGCWHTGTDRATRQQERRRATAGGATA